MDPQAPYDNMESSTSIMSKSLALSTPFPQPVEPIVALTQAGRPNRTRRLPKRYLDTPPVAPAPVEQPTSTVQTPLLRRVILHVQDFMRTTTNKFRLLREYHHRPPYDPDERASPEELTLAVIQHHLNYLTVAILHLLGPSRTCQKFCS
jgi:hypothetical protein